MKKRIDKFRYLCLSTIMRKVVILCSVLWILNQFPLDARSQDRPEERMKGRMGAEASIYPLDVIFTGGLVYWPTEYFELSGRTMIPYISPTYFYDKYWGVRASILLPRKLHIPLIGESKLFLGTEYASCTSVKDKGWPDYEERVNSEYSGSGLVICFGFLSIPSSMPGELGSFDFRLDIILRQFDIWRFELVDPSTGEQNFKNKEVGSLAHVSFAFVVIPW